MNPDYTADRSDDINTLGEVIATIIQPRVVDQSYTRSDGALERDAAIEPTLGRVVLDLTALDSDYIDASAAVPLRIDIWHSGERRWTAMLDRERTAAWWIMRDGRVMAEYEIVDVERRKPVFRRITAGEFGQLLDDEVRAVNEKIAARKGVEQAETQTNPSHQFDERAARFYADTGILAPGKDDPIGVMDYDERLDAWRRWQEEKR